MESAAQLRPGFALLALRRRWRILVAGLLIGLALGALAVVAAPTSYTSQASLFLNPVAGNPYDPEIGTSRTDQLVALETEASLVATPQVAALARARSTRPLPDSAEDSVSANAPSNSTVLRVSFSAGDPAVAAAGAQAFAEGYLDYRRQRAETANAASAAQFQQQYDAIALVLQQTADALAQAEDDSSNAILLEQQLNAYSTQLAQLNLQLIEVQGVVPPTGEVLDPATAATAPSGFPPLFIVVGATIAMLGVAVVVALAREHGDDRVRDPEELVGVGIGHPLATVPTGESAVQLQQVPPAGYRLLLTMIANRDTRGGAVVCVLGTDSPQTAMAVAAGLAASAHRLGRRSLLVGTPRPLQWWGAHEIGADEVGLPDDVPEADAAPTILRFASDEVDIEQLVLSSSLGTTLERARHSYDLVVLFGGSGTSAAGRRFAELADLTLVVATLDQDDFAGVLGLVQTLQQSGVEHLSLVAAKAAGSDQVKWSDGTAAAPAVTRESARSEGSGAPTRKGRRAAKSRSTRADQRLGP